MFKSLSKPVQWMVLGSLLIVAYLLLEPMLFPEDAPHVARTVIPKKSSTKGDMFLKEDYTAHFERVATTPKDNFKPIVYKVPNVKIANAQMNIIPPAFAGGEQNWSYTGSAEIDGVLEALLENKVTGDNVFLKVGDTWKGISVEEITDDTLVLASPETGLEKKLELPTEDTPAAGFAPVNPPLRGNIGPLGVQPDGSAMQPDMTGNGMDNGNGNGNGNGGGFGRRGGGRRGGGRRGGGGAGADNLGG
jgi:uncharacterized membrane protein YgcG